MHEEGGHTIKADCGSNEGPESALPSDAVEYEKLRNLIDAAWSARSERSISVPSCRTPPT